MINARMVNCRSGGAKLAGFREKLVENGRFPARKNGLNISADLILSMRRCGGCVIFRLVSKSCCALFLRKPKMGRHYADNPEAQMMQKVIKMSAFAQKRR
jgi:hypothetical protein